MHGLTRRDIATPVGRVRIYVMRGKPVRVVLGGAADETVPLEPAPPSLVEEMEESLAAYFAGGDIERDLALRLLGCIPLTPFEEAVYRAVIAIPRGSTLSYGEVAERAGHPRAARAVGNAMRENPYPIFVPCHRVIRADGGLGGYGGREDVKARLLIHEGVKDTPRA